jgi:hypothetical protein
MTSVEVGVRFMVVMELKTTSLDSFFVLFEYI